MQVITRATYSGVLFYSNWIKNKINLFICLYYPSIIRQGPSVGLVSFVICALNVWGMVSSSLLMRNVMGSSFLKRLLGPLCHARISPYLFQLPLESWSSVLIYFMISWVLTWPCFSISVHMYFQLRVSTDEDGLLRYLLVFCYGMNQFPMHWWQNLLS